MLTFSERNLFDRAWHLLQRKKIASEGNALFLSVTLVLRGITEIIRAIDYCKAVKFEYTRTYGGAEVTLRGFRGGRDDPLVDELGGDCRGSGTAVAERQAAR